MSYSLPNVFMHLILLIMQQTAHLKVSEGGEEN